MKTLLKKLQKLRPWIPYLRIAAALYIVITSLYDIGKDVNEWRKEHGVLLIGILGLIKAIYEIYDNTQEVKEELSIVEEKIK